MKPHRVAQWEWELMAHLTFSNLLITASLRALKPPAGPFLFFI